MIPSRGFLITLLIVFFFIFLKIIGIVHFMWKIAKKSVWLTPGCMLSRITQIINHVTVRVHWINSQIFVSHGKVNIFFKTKVSRLAHGIHQITSLDQPTMNIHHTIKRSNLTRTEIIISTIWSLWLVLSLDEDDKWLLYHINNINTNNDTYDNHLCVKHEYYNYKNITIIIMWLQVHTWNLTKMNNKTELREWW